MGKVKQLSIDLGIDEVEDVVRFYMINDVRVTKELFIKNLAYDIFTNSADMNIRETIECLLKDCNSDELICFGDRKYFTYIPEIVKENYPLKSYEVSYDIEIQPLVPSMFDRRKKWKRITETVEASRFKDAKEIVRTRLNNEGKNYKCVDVVEKLSEKSDENV